MIMLGTCFLLLSTVMAQAQPLVFYGDASFPPYEFVEEGIPKGANIDLLHEVGRVLNRPVEIRLTDWAEAQAKIRDGTGHALSLMARTPEREQVYGFSESTFPMTYSLFVLASGVTDFEKVQLTSRRIGVTSAGLPRAHFEKLHPDVPLVHVTDYADGVRRLLRGEIDALAAATWTGTHFLHELNISGITHLSKPFAERTAGIAVPRDNAVLLADIDRALTQLKQNGTFDRIIDRWAGKRIHILSELELWLAGLAGGSVLMAAALLCVLLVAMLTKRKALDRQIAAQRETEAALRASEEELRHTVDLNPQVPWTADPQGNILDCGSRWLELTGTTREQALGGGWMRVQHPEDLTRLSETWERSVSTGEPYDIEHRIRLADGSCRWMRSRAFPRRDGLGNIVRWYGTTEDVHARKESEDALRNAKAELEALAADLERRVEERTAQLVQAQKMEAVGQLTSGVAHDFNNVLQGVSGCLAVLEGRVKEEGAQRLFRAAQQGIERGARLTQHLLAFARRQTLSPRSTDVAAMLDAMRPLLERSMGGLIRIGIEVQEGTRPALVDPTQLEVAVLNLAINARDAMPLGGMLSVCVANAVVMGNAEPDVPQDLKPGDYVVVSVTDTGIGMDAATLARVYEPFFTTKDVGKGSGLGLSMVHGMAAQSGGGVAIRSRPGHGTTVSIYLPPAYPAPQEAETAAATATVANGNGRVVLLVDDDDLVRTGTKAFLEAIGYRVLVTDSGMAALDALRCGATIDALLTDYAMPGMSGVVLAQEVRCLVPGLPVLMMTGYADRPHGMDGIVFIQKPFRPSDLSAQLTAVLGDCNDGKVVPFASNRRN